MNGKQGNLPPREEEQRIEAGPGIREGKGERRTDYRFLVESVSMACAVLSVEDTGNGSWGKIRIEWMNEAYKRTMGPLCREGMLYQELVPADVKFEDFCYRSAVLGKRMRAYVETKGLGGWTDQTLIPLKSKDEGIGYCQFIFEFTQGLETDHLSGFSTQTAQEALKAWTILLKAQDFKQGIRDVVEDIARVSGAASSKILLVDHKHQSTENFVEYIREEKFRVGIPKGGNVPYDTVKTWDDTIGVSNCVVVKNDWDLKRLGERNPVWERSLREHHISSLMLIPLRQENSYIGYFYLLDFDADRWVEIKEMMEVSAFLLGTEISNHLLLRRLEIMSRTDELTGLLNRNAMIEYLPFLNGHAFGVVNLDLNGLKVVNDQEGHEAGDRLLVQAAEAIKKVFYQEDVFRTGGDEFIVIAKEIQKDVFLRMASQLHWSADKNLDLSFAMGTCWSDGNMDVDAVLRCADRRMYEDKAEYYRKTGAARGKKGWK